MASPDWCDTLIGPNATELEAAVSAQIDWEGIRSFRGQSRPAEYVPNPQVEPVDGRIIGARQSTEASALPYAERRFALRRVIVMRHRGRFANKMIQYMAAMTLASRIKDCTIVNVSIPEWGIEIPDDTQDQLFFDNIKWDYFRINIEELCNAANRSQSIRIILDDYLQRMDFLMRQQFYFGIFPQRSDLSHEITDNDLLINIRAAEILNGMPQYPLLPIAFYEDIVTRAGLKPVFTGQLNNSEYVRQLRLRFPGARFINSQGARADFDLIRSAKNIVIAVSTFSWLAAWLSDAVTIILPLNGIFNPAHHREVDLLPVDDIRYRYFLFPLNYGLPERESLQYHERIKGHWKELSRSQVALLKSSSPFLRAPWKNYKDGMPTRSAQKPAITFDPVWYAHQYIDAAMEISEGWFEDPLHHYLEVGRLRGYRATCPIQDEYSLNLTLPNIARNKRATQSSISQWSRGSTPEEDAGHAINGNPEKDYGFHTDFEPYPWWMVDLGSAAQVHFIRIYNRDFVSDSVQLRASPLLVEVSNEGEHWKPLFNTRPGYLFGGYSGGSPLLWSAKEPLEARFVRISIPRREALHLAEVEIYGRFLSDSAGKSNRRSTIEGNDLPTSQIKMDPNIPPSSKFHQGIHYYDYLKQIHQVCKPSSYLEIGVETGQTLALAQCRAVAIDPIFKLLQGNPIDQRVETYFFQLRSDEFFAQHNLRAYLPDGVDFAFLDGMHHFEYLLRDFSNTEKYSNKNTIVALHDCYPVNTEIANRETRADSGHLEA